MISTGSEKRPADELHMGLDLSTQQVHWTTHTIRTTHTAECSAGTCSHHAESDHLVTYSVKTVARLDTDVQPHPFTLHDFILVSTCDNAMCLIAVMMA